MNHTQLHLFKACIRRHGHELRSLKDPIRLLLQRDLLARKHDEGLGLLGT